MNSKKTELRPEPQADHECIVIIVVILLYIKAVQLRLYIIHAHTSFYLGPGLTQACIASPLRLGRV